MPVDFDSLVLKPNQRVFGQMVTWYPVKSRGSGSYRGKGILRIFSKTFMGAEDTLVTTTTIDFDIRASEYTLPIPVIRDELTIDKFPGYPDKTRFWVENVFSDGFGAVKYQLGLVANDS
jgi:hypothetical protein